MPALTPLIVMVSPVEPPSVICALVVLHVPLPLPALKIVFPPGHTLRAPVIAAGAASTVTVVLTVQPLPVL